MFQMFRITLSLLVAMCLSRKSSVPENSDIFHSELHRDDVSIAAAESEPTTFNRPCIADSSELVYVDTFLATENTLAKCLNKVIDPLFVPNYYNGTFHGPLRVNTSIVLNNLHVVDDVAGLVTLDFYLRLYWKDDRLSMPAFWELQASYLQLHGLEISSLVSEGGLWKPDVRFHDAQSMEVLVQTIRLNASNVLFWSRHIVGTFMQPHLDFKKYPNDNQDIIIRYGSYAYRESVFKLGFWGNPVTLNQNYDNTFSFEENPVWDYDGETSYNTYTSSSSFSNAVYKVAIKRNGEGVITRLVFPIGLLLVLAGVSYWASSSDRVNMAITLLLSVSALYIVIIGNIPLLGYLTALDNYVFYMFVLLICVVITHQVYATLKDKAITWPLRIFYMRLIEFGGRVTVFPAIVSLYYQEVGGEHRAALQILIAMSVITATIFIRELFGLYRSYKETVDAIIIKTDISERNKLSINLSILEKFVLNHHFGKIIADYDEKATITRDSEFEKDLQRIKDTDKARPFVDGGERRFGVVIDHNLVDFDNNLVDGKTNNISDICTRLTDIAKTLEDIEANNTLTTSGNVNVSPSASNRLPAVSITSQNTNTAARQANYNGASGRGNFKGCLMAVLEILAKQVACRALFCCVTAFCGSIMNTICGYFRHRRAQTCP